MIDFIDAAASGVVFGLPGKTPSQRVVCDRCQRTVTSGRQKNGIDICHECCNTMLTRSSGPNNMMTHTRMVQDMFSPGGGKKTVKPSIHSDTGCTTKMAQGMFSVNHDPLADFFPVAFNS